AVAACGVSGATFSASGPCLVDGRAAGAFPDLEARAPRSLVGKAPSSLDSGRNCSTGALGTLAAHDVHELDFGGSTWDEGQGAGTTIATLALPNAPFPLAWAEEFYLAGAINAGKTDNVKSSHPTIAGVRDAFRIDALNDLSQQAIVLWQLGNDVRIVLVATHVDPNASMAAHEARVQAAIQAALAAAPGNDGPVITPSGSSPVLSSP
ncbi:MAG TPA: hypothetical protein VF484_05590, partial [Candidatus Limnocylindrales bacterium]